MLHVSQLLSDRVIRSHLFDDGLVEPRQLGLSNFFTLLVLLDDVLLILQLLLICGNRRLHTLHFGLRGIQLIIRFVLRCLGLSDDLVEARDFLDAVLGADHTGKHAGSHGRVSHVIIVELNKFLLEIGHDGPLNLDEETLRLRVGEADFGGRILLAHERRQVQVLCAADDDDTILGRLVSSVNIKIASFALVRLSLVGRVEHGLTVDDMVHLLLWPLRTERHDGRLLILALAATLPHDVQLAVRLSFDVNFLDGERDHHGLLR